MRLYYIISIIIVLSVFSACSGLKLQDYPSENCVKMPGEKTQTVIKDRCGLCHKGDFATKELICARKAAITDSVKEKRMPKFGTLSNDELAILLKWEQ